MSIKTQHRDNFLARVSIYVRTYGIQIKNNWVREIVYRTNFITSLVVDMIWIGVEFSLFAVIYSSVGTIAGWTQDQVYFFLGVFLTSDAIFTTFFQRNFWQFSDLVNKAELDILLTKPVHPLFLALSRWIALTSIFNVALGVAVAVKYSKAAGFAGAEHPAHWLLFILWVLIGVFSQMMIRFALSIWIFWTERSWALQYLYYQFFNFASKPDSLYPQVLRYVLLTALPFAFIASVPARALLHGLSAKEYALVFGVLVVFAFINRALWRAGLRRYQSASS